MGRHMLGATGLALVGLGMLRLARRSTHPPVMWLGAATTFIGALRVLSRGGDSEHTASFKRIEV